MQRRIISHLGSGSAGAATSPSADGTTRYFATFDVAAGLELVRLSDQLAALQAERDELVEAARALQDLDAVRSLVDTPAAAEQIALARIEGIASSQRYDATAKRIEVIARKAPGVDD